MTIYQIIDSYHHKLYKLCLFYLKNPQEAEEALQEIFIKIMKKIQTFKGESDLYTWIYRIAVNTLLNVITRKKILSFISLENPKGVNYDAIGEGATQDDPAILLEEQQEKQKKLLQLQQCLTRLSHREKTAFYFYHYEGLKQKEIAWVMNTSLSAVEALLHKGMKKVKRCVQTD